MHSLLWWTLDRIQVFVLIKSHQIMVLIRVEQPLTVIFYECQNYYTYIKNTINFSNNNLLTLFEIFYKKILYITILTELLQLINTIFMQCPISYNSNIFDLYVVQSLRQFLCIIRVTKWTFKQHLCCISCKGLRGLTGSSDYTVPLYQVS